jgi:hypothetical protein
MLSSAAALLALTAVRWMTGPSSEAQEVPSLADHVAQIRAGHVEADSCLGPLVADAQAFARVLTPPKPQAAQEAPPATAAAPPFTPPRLTPQFSLLSTTYYREDPGRSLALVSEPDGEGRWVGKGERLGHGVVERVEKGMLVYRDGNDLREVPLPQRQGVPLARLQPNPSIPASPGDPSRQEALP